MKEDFKKFTNDLITNFFDTLIIEKNIVFALSDKEEIILYNGLKKLIKEASNYYKKGKNMKDEINELKKIINSYSEEIYSLKILFEAAISAKKEVKKVLTLSMWQKQFPKSFKLVFPEYTDDYENNLWLWVGEILDYFDENTDYEIDLDHKSKNHYQVHILLNEYPVINPIIRKTSKKAFLAGLNQLLKHYENTL